MSFWRQLEHGVRALANRRQAERDIDDELADYYRRAEGERMAGGLTPEEARRQTRLECGHPMVAGEQLRASRWETVLWQVAVDVRYAARRLRRDPGLTAVGALTLALGIGAGTAIFSAVHPILIAPLPYPHAGRIVAIWDRSTSGEPGLLPFGSFSEIAARSRSLAAATAWKAWQPTLTGRDAPERLDGQAVTAGYFRTLGVPPILGRDFVAGDDRLRGPRVAILGDSLWRRRFAADPAIVGRQVKLDGQDFAVIGVLPRRFENVVSPGTEIWSPLQYDATLPLQGREWGHHLRVLARLRPGVELSAAIAEIGQIARTPVAELHRAPGSSLVRGLVVTALQADVTRGVRPALVAIMGAVGLLILIVCANVSSLLLARGAERRGELSLRAALGAGRMRLVRQLVTESLLLGFVGGELGLLVAHFGVRALVALSPAQLPRAAAIRLDGSAFAFAFGITTAIGIVVGLLPALRESRREARGGVHLASQRVAGRRSWVRGALAVAEIALALVLLLGAGLLWRSMRHVLGVAPGFDAAHLLTMEVQTYGPRYDDDAACNRFFAQALEAVRRVPGVTAAGFTSALPLSGALTPANVPDVYGVRFENDNDPSDNHDATRAAVSPGYFAALGIPLRRGRWFDRRDDAPAAARPVVISESFARRKFPGEDPLGQRLRFAGPDRRPWDVIVGVVGDVRQTSLAARQEDLVYVSSAQWLWADGARWLAVRIAGDPAALAAAIKAAIWSVDKDQPVVRVATMAALLAASTAERRFVLVLFAAFALAALALAAIGIYGIMASTVAERRRELGVRSALGASSGDLLRQVLRQGLALAGLGITAGLAVSLAASRALAALLFGVSRLDPLTHCEVVAILAAVSALACLIPAHRAAHTDPAITLRNE